MYYPAEIIEEIVEKNDIIDVYVKEIFLDKKKVALSLKEV